MEGLTYKLMNWYSRNKRPLPWRSATDAYKVWLSEIILQQTRVAQGSAYYLKFVSAFPEIEDLAKAKEREVLKLWEGLGYYSRARNLHETSKYIVNELDAVFPDNYRDLLKLKGVGKYTAAAIASIVYNEPRVAIDGNVLRVSSRLFLINDPIDKLRTQETIRSILQNLIDIKIPGDFNQAMMELGALICTPKNPNCNLCPLNIHCLALADKKQGILPVKAGKTKVKKIYFNYVVPVINGKTIISERKSGIWKGMYQFPLIESDGRLLNQKEIEHKIKELGFSSFKDLSASPVVNHLLTHRKIMARFWSFNTDDLNGFESKIVVGKKDLVKYPMPQLIVNYLQSESHASKATIIHL